MAQMTASELVEWLDENGHNAHEAVEFDGAVVRDIGLSGLSNFDLPNGWAIYAVYDDVVHIT